MTAVAGIASSALRPVGTGGWVGYWSPGIGDPTFVGWLTVVLYFAATLSCWGILRRHAHAMAAAEKTVWRTLMVALALLGVNKQLDLQTALTEFGRRLSADEGWYDVRRRVQREFILAVGLAAIAAAGLLLAATRRMPAATSLTAVGASALLAFVLVRASSFHHVDLFIRSEWWGLRGNWLIEVGGLLVILAGEAWRWRSPSPVAVHATFARARAGPDRRIRTGLSFGAPRRMPWLVGATTTLGLLGALAIAGSVPPRYRAGTVIQGTWGAEDARAVSRGDDPQSRHLGDLWRRVSDPSTIRRFTESSPSGGPRGVDLASLRIDPVSSRDFSVEYDSGDPEEAAGVVNRLAGLLAEQVGSQRLADPAVLEARLDAARKDVDERTEALRRLQVQPPERAVRPPEDPTSGERARLAAQRRSVARDLKAAREKVARLKEELARVSGPVAPDPQMSADLAALRAHRARLLARYTESHPDVEAISARIRRVEAAMASRAAAPSPQIADLERQLAEARAAVETLGRESDRLGGELARLPAPARAAPAADPKPLADREALVRDLEQAKATYAAAREDWRAAEVASGLGTSSLTRIEVVRPATVPLEPFYPNRLLFALVGLASGLLAGLAVSLVLALAVRPARSGARSA